MEREAAWRATAEGHSSLGCRNVPVVGGRRSCGSRQGRAQGGVRRGPALRTRNHRRGGGEARPQGGGAPRESRDRGGGAGRRRLPGETNEDKPIVDSEFPCPNELQRDNISASASTESSFECVFVLWVGERRATVKRNMVIFELLTKRRRVSEVSLRVSRKS